MTSLSFRRQKQQELSRKEYLDPTVRIRDLEIELIRMQDHVLELDETVRSQSASLAKILRLLQSALGASSSGSYPVGGKQRKGRRP